MKIYVTNKACHECFFTPERVLSSQETRELIEWCLHDDKELGHIPECHCVTIARQKWNPSSLPFEKDAITCCFAFFYCYGRQQVYLREAIEQGLIEYVDITGWEGLRESGRVLYTSSQTGKPWERGPMTHEQLLWVDEVAAKYGG